MVTPARRQYLDIKARFPDAILLYQVGDFYETFDEDARVAASELQIVLTSRAYGPDERVPLAGVPVHAMQGYAARLVERGYKVAICEQTSPAGRGLVRREVTRILTPGTVADPAMAPSRRDNYLAAVSIVTQRLRREERRSVGMAYVEVSSGSFACTQWDASTQSGSLIAELERLQPAEILLADGATVPWMDAESRAGDEDAHIRWPSQLPAPTTTPAGYFDAEEAHARLCRQLSVPTLEAFGCEGATAATSAAGALVAYLQRMNPPLLRSVRSLRTYDTGGNVQIDGRTWRALEVVEPTRTGFARGGRSRPGLTLLGTLDSTRTSMGARALRRQVLQPIRDRGELEARLDAVEELVRDTALRQRIDGALRGVGDGERLVARIAHGTATPRELLALAALLARLPELRAAMERVRATRLRELLLGLDGCDEARATIDAAIDDGVSGSNGKLRAGFDAALDELVRSSAEARGWIAALEPRERERTGIKSLKVGYNRIFGYYLEVSRANGSRVPDDYERRQTLTGGERYVTPELKEHEARVLHAEEQIEALEGEIYARLLDDLAGYQERLLATSAAVAQVDVLLSLAEVAVRRGYARPELTEGTEFDVRGGRHPMLEGALDGHEFIPNDVFFDSSADGGELGEQGVRVLLLTGPNMAGKSTYLRQVALIALLAHVGSFVPAEFARIGIVDRIFTRVGAEDDLAAGLSTFMLEMLETAFILRHATERSLVALDEVGRGTSTRDGLAIARAVIEYLHDQVRARTLFATHFHELAALAETLPRLRLYRMDVAERDGRTVFLHRVVAGASDESYGVHVARIAGIPSEVTRRADDLLAHPPQSLTAFAERAGAYDVTLREGDAPSGGLASGSDQSSLLSSGAEQVLFALAGVNIAATTPLEGLNVLFSLQQRAIAALQRRGG
jgi:DNA mismatch repair protein MutS